MHDTASSSDGSLDKVWRVRLRGACGSKDQGVDLATSLEYV
jgi:hypothetical protein